MTMYSRLSLFTASRQPWKRFCLGVAATMWLSLAAGARQTDTDAVTLRMKFKPGETHKYQMNMRMQFDINVPGQEAPVSQKVDSKTVQQQKVLSVTPEGVATIETTTVSSEITVNGATKPGPEIKPITTVIDARGNTLSVKGMPVMAGMPDFSKMFGNGFAMTYLPEKPVRVGDTWAQKYSIPTLTAEGSKLTTTFVRREAVGARNTALLHSATVMPMNMRMTAQGQFTTKPEETAMQMTGDLNVTSDANMDVVNGRLVRSVGGSEGTITMHAKQAPQGQPDTIKMNLKMKMSFNLMD